MRGKIIAVMISFLLVPGVASALIINDGSDLGFTSNTSPFGTGISPYGASGDLLFSASAQQQVIASSNVPISVFKALGISEATLSGAFAGAYAASLVAAGLNYSPAYVPRVEVKKETENYKVEIIVDKEAFSAQELAVLRQKTNTNIAELSKNLATLKEWTEEEQPPVVEFNQDGAVKKPDGSFELLPEARGMGVSDETFTKQDALKKLREFEALNTDLINAMDVSGTQQRKRAVEEALEALDTQAKLIGVLAEGY